MKLPKNGPRKHPGLELIDARIQLANTPQSAPMIRKLLQMKIQNLEHELRIHSGEKKHVPMATVDTLKADEVLASTDGTRRLQQHPQTDRPVEPFATSGPRTGDVLTGHPGGDEMEPKAGGRTKEGTTTEEADTATLAPYREALYREAREDIQRADVKAMFFLTALVWVLVLLINHSATTSWFYGPGGWQFKDLVSLTSVLCLVISVSMMLRVLSPSWKEFNPLNLLAVKLIMMRRGFWIGVAAVSLALLFLILSKEPHPPIRRPYY